MMGGCNYRQASMYDRIETSGEAFMPRGPRGEQRPADSIGCAVKVAQIATGELEESLDEPAAPSRQSQGGSARAAKLTAKERSEIARKAAKARWGSA